jgi:tripartite-type tricarboxylate transporter receptor subunit TctC
MIMAEFFVLGFLCLATFTLLTVQNHGRMSLPCLLAAFALITPNSAPAQSDYPSRPIKIVVPFAPGSIPDLLSRLASDKLTGKWGQPVIVENRPGASGNVGAEAVARAEPDGYTLLSAPPPPIAINQHLFPKMNFDPGAFAPVTVIAAAPNVLVAHPNLPASNVEELIGYARANPGKLSGGSTGNGGTPHLTLEMLMAAAGVRVTHVPYSRGLPPALVDLFAERIDIMFVNLADALPHVRSGKLKAIAVASETRIPELPNTAAIAETLPGFRSTTWYAVVAPPKTPAAIVAKLSNGIAEVLRLPEVARRLHDLSATPVGTSPEQSGAFITAESNRWRDVIVSAGVKLE